ncbi:MULTISPECIES: DUF3793 family protein [Oscillospiraceae]|uniref:DUF3793 family protein n=1 Tax=Lawsonibacter faecis TaxID=2763052 RepID=A0A8J6JM25_9FIRM|nr:MULTISPECIES: DUF3793 family protein [Oscillospiraceae]MTQ98411.1 DUF3793 family protein [Pseudoflavonifractor sp. BIOML-A16]MTR05630.1 DUF3793 family protein [Pseudoflavonifractor sp. BIOML-A15]MTR34173.1 DUF3793 family protein [Pseudoflavonifractor sp. BIOML-A14]MTR74312.1 DUF3793 family protein [Pseudoflavonifractor sp. BIOML-A18]MTS65841.1 DUF3793 family protein [Pseudoflavonifractor sp. BIOML-A5]MTS71800.1 DUF3793 family protein [Pseudoflavonifractor sp. BIOML-A8]MTS91114.1 DUF3793 f
MYSARFEEVVVRHCSPTLVGIKPACLISLDAAEYPRLPRTVGEYTRALGEKGLRFEVLCRCRRRFLVLVFRPKLLAEHLARPQAAQLLADADYPGDAPLSALLRRLRQRLLAGGDFPHEIGLFLGYPSEDVAAFQTDGGAGCRLCGYWKVYHDVEGARRQFLRYDRCRDALLDRLRAGMTLSRLFGVPSAPAA